MSALYTAVGILRKPHGISGAFSFVLHREPKSLKKLPPHFFLQKGGAYLPYFVTTIELKDLKNGYIRFEEVTNPELAKLLNGSELFLEQKTINAYFKKDADDYGYLMGYTIYDGDRELGLIDDIIELPAQVLAIVQVQGNEVMIPLADDLIISIDKRTKRIVFALPDGLVQL